MSKILVTGATGFIGANLAKLIPDARLVTRSKENQTSKDLFLIDNLDDKTDWSGAFDEVEAIIHLAALAHSNSYTVADYTRINVSGSLRLAQEAFKAGVSRFVYVSSIGVNGFVTVDHAFSPDSHCNPHNLYSKSKLDTEKKLSEFGKASGMEVVIVRPTLVYGAKAPGNFGMLTRLIRNTPILPFGLVNNRRDFIAVQNLVDLLATCAVHPKAGGNTFLASDGKAVSIKEFTEAIANGLDKNVLNIPIPVSFMRVVAKVLGKSAMIEQLLGNLEVDSTNIRDVLGWTAPYTMEQAMASLSENE